MKKILSLLVASILTATQVSAQDARAAAQENQGTFESTDITKIPDGWKKNADVLFGGVWTNTADWIGAAEKYNVTTTLSAILKADRKKGKTLFLNEARWVYGQLMSPSTLDRFRKAQDQLLLSTMYAPQIKPKWFHAARVNVNTQLAPSNVYDAAGNKISVRDAFMAPGIIRAGYGIMYRPNSKFKLYFSPLTANIATKFGSRFRPLNLFGVEANKSMRFGLGSLLSTEYNVELFKKIGYKTRVDAFTDYLRSPFQVIDLDWLNSVNFNLSKNISVAGVMNIRNYFFQQPKVQYLHTVGLSGAFKL